MRFIKLNKVSYYTGAPEGEAYVNPQLICSLEATQYTVKAAVDKGLRPGDINHYTIVTFPGGGDENNNMITVKETPEQIVAMIGASE